jgi:hypothetical protein
MTKPKKQDRRTKPSDKCPNCRERLRRASVGGRYIAFVGHSVTCPRYVPSHERSAAKPKREPFKRWSAEFAHSDEQQPCIVYNNGNGDVVRYLWLDADALPDQPSLAAIIVAALNAARITLPKGNP